MMTDILFSNVEQGYELHTGQGLPFEWLYDILMNKLNSGYDQIEGGIWSEKESRRDAS